MKSLSRDITFSLILVVASASIITTLSSYLFLSYQSKALHEAKSEEYINYLREGLELPLWKMDDDAVERICRSFTKNEVIAFLRITSEKGDLIFEEKDEKAMDVIKNSAPLTYENQVIGHVEIGLTPHVYNSGELPPAHSKHTHPVCRDLKSGGGDKITPTEITAAAA